MKRTIRDTINYTLYCRGRMVYHGITNNLFRRLAEHEREGMYFDEYTYSAKRSRASARRHESEDIARYFWSQGRLPKYNRQF